MKKILVALVCACAYGQEGQPVSVDAGPPRVGYTELLYYDSDDLEYVCAAKSIQPTTMFRRSDSTITSITDSSNTATVVIPNHGLSVNNGITISGATVDADLNGTYAVVSVSDANTFTITTASVSDAAYTDATMVVSTTAPRTNKKVWSILKMRYSASKLIAKQWASGSSVTSQHVCDDRATLTYQ